jgi:hypothetical protein
MLIFVSIVNKSGKASQPKVVVERQDSCFILGRPRYYISVLRPAVVVFLSFSKRMLEQYISLKDSHFIYTL